MLRELIKSRGKYRDEYDENGNLINFEEQIDKNPTFIQSYKYPL